MLEKNNDVCSFSQTLLYEKILIWIPQIFTVSTVSFHIIPRNRVDFVFIFVCLSSHTKCDNQAVNLDSRMVTRQFTVLRFRDSLKNSSVDGNVFK